MFRVKTQKNASVLLEHRGVKIHTKTLDDGYFKFCIPLTKNSDFGWNDYRVSIFTTTKKFLKKELTFARMKEIGDLFQILMILFGFAYA